MNPPRTAPHAQEPGAADALFDQIELDLLALATAPLDSRSGEPPRCVDEFADDFFSRWSMPGGGAGPAGLAA